MFRESEHLKATSPGSLEKAQNVMTRMLYSSNKAVKSLVKFSVLVNSEIIYKHCKTIRFYH